VLRDDTSEQAGKGTRHGGGGVVERETRGEFVLFVPRREVKRYTGRKSSFCDAKSEADGSELTPVVGGGHTGGDTPKEDGETT
jgi:hypothetical protein